jgi:hypothetical protein
MSATELTEIKSNIVEDIVEKIHISTDDAIYLLEMASIDSLLLKHPHHVRHYPIEMITNKVLSLVYRSDAKN